MADRGPYGLHLDFLMNLEDVVNLMDLFSAESVLQFQQQVWDFEESIYEALKTEVYGLPKVKYDRRDLHPSFYAFFACVCNQIDPQDSDRRLQRIHVLERCRPLTSLDDYLDNVIPVWCWACQVPSMSAPLRHHVLMVNDLRHHRRLHPLRTPDIFTRTQTQ